MKSQNNKSIKNMTEYALALKRVLELMNAEKDTPEGKELDHLVDLILEYEKKHTRFLND
jgi:HTH-type transcriptional regulator / antitoxin HigA